MLRLHDNGLAAVERNSIQCLSEGDAASKVGASSETPCCRLLVICQFV
jgi:queuine tRNA-ribosyltransferase subunit QTRTD1